MQHFKFAAIVQVNVLFNNWHDRQVRESSRFTLHGFQL